MAVVIETGQVFCGGGVWACLPEGDQLPPQLHCGSSDLLCPQTDLRTHKPVLHHLTEAGRSGSQVTCSHAEDHAHHLAEERSQADHSRHPHAVKVAFDFRDSRTCSDWLDAEVSGLAR